MNGRENHPTERRGLFGAGPAVAVDPTKHLKVALPPVTKAQLIEKASTILGKDASKMTVKQIIDGLRDVEALAEAVEDASEAIRRTVQ